MPPLLRCFFAHLLILQYPDHHQNLISSSLYYSGPVHKISSQSVNNFLSNVHRQTNRQTNKQTDKLTNATKNITKPQNLLCQEVKEVKRLWIITCTTIWLCYRYYGVYFAHLLILEYSDHHQNLISSSLYYPGPLHKISRQSVYNLLSNVVHRQTDKPTLPKT